MFYVLLSDKIDRIDMVDNPFSSDNESKEEVKAQKKVKRDDLGNIIEEKEEVKTSEKVS